MIKNRIAATMKRKPRQRGARMQANISERRTPARLDVADGGSAPLAVFDRVSGPMALEVAWPAPRGQR